MKTVAAFLNPEEAKVARSFLVANGIDAFISGEESLSVMPHIGMGAKSYQLMVDDEDEPMAKRLLDEIEENAAKTMPQHQATGWTSKRVFLALALVVTLFFLFVGNSYSHELAVQGERAKAYLSCLINSWI